ncbi:MAG: hypothetical protein HY549_05605 [Elusimicrobia bacterium]|nr:hypothetical protein [Elusimicrobiota bacterium]
MLIASDPSRLEEAEALALRAVNLARRKGGYPFALSALETVRRKKSLPSRS